MTSTIRLRSSSSIPRKMRRSNAIARLTGAFGSQDIDKSGIKNSAAQTLVLLRILSGGGAYGGSPQSDPAPNLVDQLAMAYSISGRTADAKTAPTGGCPGQSRLPRSYHDLACVAADETRQAGSVEESHAGIPSAVLGLRLGGEHIPDPGSDPLSQKYAQDADLKGSTARPFCPLNRLAAPNPSSCCLTKTE